ncbi:hypothetical protein NQZ68_012589 [Dissostichus eleginoides]|nr:hypothetical protein NQZ68_012589 [Dissostichus eleginoides]
MSRSVFSSSVAAVSLQEMRVFTELGQPSAPGCTISADMTINKHGSDFSQTGALLYIRRSVGIISRTDEYK